MWEAKGISNLAKKNFLDGQAQRLCPLIFDLSESRAPDLRFSMAMDDETIRIFICYCTIIK